jgi:hypothetical protein
MSFTSRCWHSVEVKRHISRLIDYPRPPRSVSSSSSVIYPVPLGLYTYDSKAQKTLFLERVWASFVGRPDIDHNFFCRLGECIFHSSDLEIISVFLQCVTPFCKLAANRCDCGIAFRVPIITFYSFGLHWH